MTDTKTSIGRALISVSDKTGIVDFATGLAGFGVEILSTGGTAAALKAAGLTVTDISDYTGFPEMMDGRLKTLHPKVHGGLLAVRGQAEHEAAAAAHGMAAIAQGAAFDVAIENIDIGGPAMLRAAAKNHAAVTVLVDPADYPLVLEELRAGHGATSQQLRKTLAAKAFARTAAYDAAISGWFADVLGERAPAWRAFGGKLARARRYGENPHKNAPSYL